MWKPKKTEKGRKEREENRERKKELDKKKELQILPGCLFMNCIKNAIFSWIFVFFKVSTMNSYHFYNVKTYISETYSDKTSNTSL